MQTFFVLSLGWLAISSQGLLAAPRSTLAKTMPGGSVESSSWNLLVPSFVVHGIQPQGVSHRIQRRVDPNGAMVITPGIGLEYKAANGFMILGAVIKDCYDNLAGSFQIGKKFRLSQFAEWGITAGIYARETPIFCDNEGGNCEEEQNLIPKGVVYVNGEPVDLIPLPFLHFSYTLIHDQDFDLRLKFMGNFVLNEFGLEIPF